MEVIKLDGNIYFVANKSIAAYNIIKEEIDNIIVDFKEKLENQEEQMTKNLENKIKENFEKMILQEKENNAQSQSQTNSKKNKYSKRDTKLSISYNKS